MAQYTIRLSKASIVVCGLHTVRIYEFKQLVQTALFQLRCRIFVVLFFGVIGGDE